VVHEVAWRRGEDDLPTRRAWDKVARWTSAEGRLRSFVKALAADGPIRGRTPRHGNSGEGRGAAVCFALEAKETGAPIMKATAPQPIASGAIRRANRRGCLK